MKPNPDDGINSVTLRDHPIMGKQKRVKREQTIDGMDVDEFIQRNADPIWFHQNQMWEKIEPVEKFDEKDSDEDDIPF